MALIKKHRIGHKTTIVELDDGTFAEQQMHAAANRFAASAASVSTEAVKIADVNWDRTSITIHNAGSGTIYLGVSDVTTATGFPVANGTSLTLYVMGEVWAVASGTVAVRILEQTN